MRVLLLEDSLAIGEDVQAYLKACDVECDRVTSYVSVQEAIQNNMYDVAVLDRMVPDGSGAQLCRWIKENYPMLVILQTAKSQIEDKLEGFDAGADDYLTKPYDLRELEARIHALSRRQEQSAAKIQRADFVFDLESMRVFHKEQEIHCTAHERIALKLLLENPGEAISRTVFVDYIRGSDGFWDAENKLDVLISGLRKKLDKKLIETVKGFGYRMAQ